jgi:uncharacterized oligopeptide transporter (OPT) family protein
MMKWVADQWASRQKLSPEENAKFEERGTLLASGLIAGEAITGILLATRGSVTLFPQQLRVAIRLLA